MEPLDLTGFRDYAADMAQPLRDWLIGDICRRVREAGSITSTAEYQIWRAEALGMAEKEIKAAIATQMRMNTAAVNGLFDGIVDKTVRFEENGHLQQLVKAYKMITTQGANRLLKDLWAPGPDGKLYTVREAYDKVMEFAFAQTFSGATDMNTALRQATKELVKRGIRTIPRKDGKSVSIEYATRSYVMNRLGSMANAVQQMNHDELGCDGWEISAHAACAPDHENVQGRQFSDAEFEKLNAHLVRPIGLLNCGHTASPIIMGVNSPQYSDAELQQMRDENQRGVTYEGHHYTLYEAGQKQAELESHIRAVKKRVLADEALGDEANLQKHQLMLARYRQEYTRFCRATGQPTRSERLQAAGFGRRQAGKANAAVQKYFSQFPSPKMQIDGILEAKKVFASPQDAQAAAVLIDEGLNNYRLPTSNFSGKVVLKNLSPEVLGRTEWNGDLSLRKDAGLDTIVHELLHTRSVVREGPAVFKINKRIEEPVIQLLTQEICKEKGIDLTPSLYDSAVEKLRFINSITGTDKTNLEFGITLINVPLRDRYDWLMEEVNEFIDKQAKRPQEEQLDEAVVQMLRKSVRFFFGGAPF